MHIEDQSQPYRGHTAVVRQGCHFVLLSVEGMHEGMHSFIALYISPVSTSFKYQKPSIPTTYQCPQSTGSLVSYKDQCQVQRHLNEVDNNNVSL